MTEPSVTSCYLRHEQKGLESSGKSAAAVQVFEGNKRLFQLRAFD